MSQEPQKIQLIWSATTLTVDELKKRVADMLGVARLENPGHDWFENGIKGKVLIAEKGGGWKVGRVRFSVEFLPDEPTQIEASTETPSVGLDEFR
jgi:hypothetical protein